MGAVRAGATNTRFIAFALAMFGAAPAAAAPLRVGAGQAYATPCDAIDAANPDDVIEVDPGTYTDSCAIDVSGVTLRGVGGQPKIDLSGTDHPAQYKGIYVVTAAGVTIENLELTGAHITPDNGSNAAAVRIEAPDLTVRACNIHDNQNGILGGTTGTITIEHSEFFHNGLDDGCNEGGCTHNLYIADVDALYFRFNWSHAIATDTPDKGHLLKSRAKQNYIEYNRLTGEDGFDSYEIDLPNGGLAVIVGNAIEKGEASGNSNMLIWGEEGASNPDMRVFVVNNTFVNDRDSGTFISANGAMLTAHNNLFVGGGTPSSGGALSADNLSGVDPKLVDRSHYDYHLTAGSPAIGHAVVVMPVDSIALAATSEYVHPLGETLRESALDVGAFEFGTDTSAGAGGDAGAINADAGSQVPQTNGGGSGGSRAGGGAAGTQASPSQDGGVATNQRDGQIADGSGVPSASSSSGCGCTVIGGRDRVPSCPIWSGAVVLGALVSYRRRRRARVVRAMTCARIRSVVVAVFCAASIRCSDGKDPPRGNAAARDAATDAGSSPRFDADGHASDIGRRTDAGLTRDAGSRARDSGAHDADTSPITPDAGGALAKLCPNTGWCELPDTALRSVCPDPDQYPEIQANEGCGGVINDWSGGVADAKRNRLLIWGGGHGGYFGNEVYALDLNALAMQRLNDPSDLAGIDVDDCTSPEAYADGRASSRHTYDGLAYVPDADVMFALAGAGIPCGYAVTGTWTFDLAKVDGAPLGSAAPWTNMNPDPYPSKASYGVVSDYDPNGERVLVDDTYNLWSYDLASNTYTLLNDSDATAAHIDYHMTGRVDPQRRLFIVVGGRGNDDGGMQIFDLGDASDYAQQDWTNEVSGCDALLAASSPGFAYDAVRDRMIGWAGGDDVYVFNPDDETCETTTYAGGPERQNENGTFGRFRAFPMLGVFAVVNDPDTNAFVLRLPP